MTDRLRIALCQANPTVGAIAANVEKVRTARAEAAAANADLMVFTELVISGYPPEDLVLKPFFLDKIEAAVRDLAGDTADDGPAMLVTAPWRGEKQTHAKAHNAVLLLAGGEIVAVRHKVDLPNYGVFDEKRVFIPGDMPGPISFKGVRIGVPICEDIWFPFVTAHLRSEGAEILISPNGSPFEVDKDDREL